MESPSPASPESPWLVFYLLFLLYAAADRTGFLVIDYANLMIHEGGHFFFSWFGHTIMILGGTLGELIVPLLCAAFFWWKRETTAVAFCSFWFFENFLYIGTYMADARTIRITARRLGGKAIGRFFSLNGVCLERICKSAQRPAPSAGWACSPPSLGSPGAFGATPKHGTDRS